jgi:type II secretory pathway component GspD/PulD (secretin)
MQFFAGSGPGRFKSLGHMAFKNEAPEWKTFQSGGTLKIRVTGRDVADLKDIDYGLILKAKGGLSDGENAALDLDLELSTPIPVGQDYDLKRNRLNSTVLCPLGKTFIMAGTKELFEGINKEGVPFLRNIPLLSFFFSEKGSKLENRKLLIMISPQLARAPEAAAPAVEQTIGTVQEADKPVTNLQKKSLR